MYIEKEGEAYTWHCDSWYQRQVGTASGWLASLGS